MSEESLPTAPPQGELTLVGRLVVASNATFLAQDEAGVEWVYKPVEGEAPLRDFPDHTLWRREIAAHELSRAAGFDCVPFTCPTDGPFGPGSAQRWVEEASDDLADLVLVDEIPEGFYGIVVGVDEAERDVALVHADTAGLRRLALFDAVANNADRKAGHILHTPDDRVLGVDHGLTFHTDHKLRTILWGWAGEPFTTGEQELLVHSLSVAEQALAPWVSDEEVEATFTRITNLVAEGTFPLPGEETWRNIPWPPV